MPTLDPQVFVAIEGAMLSALTREWATALSPVVADLYDLLGQKQWQAARMLIDTVHLNDAVPNAREQLEELAVSALLFGASNATEDLATTSYVADGKPTHAALSQALDQLQLSLQYTAAEEIRWSLHQVVAEAEQAAKIEVIGKADDRGRTLYVHRPLVNSAQLIAWAKEQGFASTLDQSDLHVTICFSREPLDWTGVTPADDILVCEGGKRRIAQFGKAIVLAFDSDYLATRHGEFLAGGASYDFDEYRPHVTLTYDAGDIDLSTVQPYRGPLEFGAEAWSEVNDSWAASITETVIQKAEKTLAQRLNEAVLEGKALIDVNANLTTSRLIALGFLSEAAEKNITTYQVSEVLDDRTCPVCQIMHGKTFSVVTEYSKILTVLGTTDPAEIRNLAPWPKQTKAGIESLRAMDRDQMQNAGLGSPPYHPSCRGFLVTLGTVTELTPMKGPLDSQIADIISDLVVPVTGPRSKKFTLDFGPDMDDAATDLVTNNFVLRGVTESLHAELPGYIPTTTSTGLLSYVGTGYQAINAQLRGQDLPTGYNVEETLPEITDVMSHMQPLEKSMVLYRTVGSSAANLGLEVGDTFTSAGFVSTSRSSLISADFVNGTSTMFRISAPKGTRAIVTNESEAEVILDHNVDFEIFDIIDVPEDTKMRELGIVNIVDIRPKA